MSMKQIFFKTVRENYTSVYARGPLCREYQIGKRYVFPAHLPAHVFIDIDDNYDSSDINVFSPDDVYNIRSESSGGNRVLICLGEVIKKKVLCFDITFPIWDFNVSYMGDYYEIRHTCYDFLVVGEIPLPDSYQGVRPKENTEYKRGFYDDSVLNLPFLEVS